MVKHLLKKRGLSQVVSILRARVIKPPYRGFTSLKIDAKAERPSLRLVSKIEKLKAEVEELMKAEENLREARQEKSARLRILHAQMYLS